MMNVEFLKKEEENVIFALQDVKSSFANSLRRVMIEEVPVMAIEDVEIRKNSSILYDEVIAHRLGLIPLTTDLKSYTLPEECKCKGAGCNRCTLKLTLKAKGPSVVYASDLKSKDPAIKPVFPKTPIVKLIKNQVLELEATAMLGKGKVHMKWSPGNIYYKKSPIIEIDGKCDACGACIEACPKGVLELSGGKAKVVEQNLLECHLCDACVEACKYSTIKIKESDDYVFYVEPWGQLSAKKILKEAARILNVQLEDFVSSLKSL